LDTGARVFDDVAGTVRTLTPRAAKGLEFDRVVLVEPAAIVAELGGIDGLRALYVALTRATKTLVIVHAQPLPEPLR
ncbi:MAG: ATPase, partial [Myxococcales bacterium]|nr:ATPase [Myxococcales bacterium]